MTSYDLHDAVKGHHSLLNVRFSHEHVELARKVGQLQVREGQENVLLELLKGSIVPANLEIQLKSLAS